MLIYLLDMEQFSQSEHFFNLESQSPKDVIGFLSDLLKSKPEDVRILEWAGFLALENKQWSMAEDIFSSLLESRNKVSDLVGLAKALCKQSRLDEAKECYFASLERIQEPCSTLFIVYKALGDIAVLEKDFAMAEEYYNKASTWNSSCMKLVFHRAMLYLKEKNYRSAERHFQTFLNSHPHSAKAWMGLALTRKALGDEDLAVACLNRSLDFNPKDLKAVNLKRKWCPSLSEMLANSLNFSA